MKLKIIEGQGRMIDNIAFAKCIIEISSKNFDGFIACKPC